MSLINDALKKAQKQRTGEAPPLGAMPTIGGEAPSRIAASSKPGGSNGLLLKIGAAAVALVVVVGGVILVMRPSPVPARPQPAVPAAAVAQAAPSAAPQIMGSNPSPTVVAPPAAETAVAPAAFVLPIASAPSPAPASAPASPVTVATKVEAKPAAAAPVDSPPVVATVKAAAPKLDGKSVNYIEGLRVAGIRASGGDSKVLMNDRVYRIGDIVEHDLDLKLVGITSSSLTFENDQGARYTRNF